MSQCDGTTLTSALCPHETSDSRTLDDLQQLKSQLIKTLTEFEFQRVEHFQPLLTHNRTYWDRFQAEMTSGTQQIQHLEDFLTRRLEADQAYVEAIRASSSSQLVSPQTLLSSFSDAFESLTRSQEQFAEKLDQFLASIRKDVVHRYLTDLSTQYKHSVEDITQRGSRFQEELTNTHTFVCDSFNSLSTILNDAVDAWRMEFAYFDSVQKWKQTRCEYVKGMAECFQQFKTMEINRITVLQKVMETYLRKQRLFYEQVAHAISEPMTAAERVHPEKDLLQSIRRIPKNETAAALQNESFPEVPTVPSPFDSPLLQRIGLLQLQLTGSLFHSWKPVIGIITLDRYFHLFDVNQSIESTNWLSQLSNSPHNSLISLSNCRIEIGGNATDTIGGKEAIFQLISTNEKTTYFNFFRDSPKFVFKCGKQQEMVDWVVALDAITTK